MRLHLLPQDAIENVFSRLSTTDIIATAAASPFLTIALSAILKRSHLILDHTTKNHFLSCPPTVATHIRHLSISSPLLPHELSRLTNVFTALDHVSFNISTPLPPHVWFQFLVAIAPSLSRCVVEFCADLPGDLILQALAPNSQHLQELTLRFTPHVYAMDLHPFLLSLGHSLRVLRLEDCIGVDDQLVIDIASYCHGLECLCLGGSEHVGDDAILAITQSPCATSLTTLDIRACMQVTDEGVFAIATSCYALKTLNLWAVCVTTYGVRAVAEGLGVHLETLVIGDCVGLNDIAVQSIADNCDALTTLEMCGLKRITDDGIMALFDTNRCGQLQLQNLTIDRCTNITSRGVLAATGLLDDLRDGMSTHLQYPQPQSCASNSLHAPFSTNENPDTTKRKQSLDQVDDGVNEWKGCETDYTRQEEDCVMVECCSSNSSEVNCYVSNLKRLSAIETRVAASVWQYIRERRKELRLVGDDCGSGNEQAFQTCCEHERMEEVCEKQNGSTGYRTNEESGVCSSSSPVERVYDVSNVELSMGFG